MKFMLKSQQKSFAEICKSLFAKLFLHISCLVKTFNSQSYRNVINIIFCLLFKLRKSNRKNKPKKSQILLGVNFCCITFLGKHKFEFLPWNSHDKNQDCVLPEFYTKRVLVTKSFMQKTFFLSYISCLIETCNL